MKFNIRGDKLKVTNAINDYVESKIGKLDKYFKDEDIEANIVVKVRGNKQIIEVMTSTENTRRTRPTIMMVTGTPPSVTM